MQSISYVFQLMKLAGPLNKVQLKQPLLHVLQCILHCEVVYDTLIVKKKCILKNNATLV